MNSEDRTNVTDQKIIQHKECEKKNACCSWQVELTAYREKRLLQRTWWVERIWGINSHAASLEQ